MSLHEYIGARISTLVDGGRSRDEIVGAIAEATASPAGNVEAFLGGSAECREVEQVEAMADVLELDVDDALQVALGGTLMESRLVEGYGWTPDGYRDVAAIGRQSKAILPGDLRADENEFISSTDVEARDGDIIDQGTWRLGHYRKNPVVLEGHRNDMVIGHTSKIAKEPNRLVSRIRWDTNELNPVGRLVAHQHAAGIRRAVSVRWITGKRVNRNTLPKDDPRYQSKPKKIRTIFGEFERFGLVHMDNTLLEQSSVSVPGDPRALQQRGIGVDGAELVNDLGNRDDVAAAEMRAQMIDALKDESLWTDDAFRANFGGLIRHLVRTDADLRRLLVAAKLTTPSGETLNDEQRLIAAL